jgi:HD-GYP domain-containing protein (c-di-GMP phosphodiesterase class II)
VIYIPITKIKTGDVLAESVYNANNQLVVKQGFIINEQQIETIKKHGVEGVYIEKEFTSNKKVEFLIDDKLRAKIINNLKNLDITGILDSADKAADDIYSNHNISLDYVDIRHKDTYAYKHAITVAETSVVIGKKMGMGRDKLVELATAALLHDIGEKCNNKDALKKAGLSVSKFADDYDEKMQPYYGFCLLNECNDISGPVKHAILFHKTDEDGTNAPKVISKLPEIHMFAKIIHFADDYDSLRYPDIYSERKNDNNNSNSYMDLPSIYEYMMGACGTKYNLQVVQAFLSVSPAYPLGTLVTLTTKPELNAIVYEHTDLPLRPIVQIVDEPLKGRFLNLTDSSTMSILIKQQLIPEEFINRDGKTKLGNIAENEMPSRGGIRR